MSTDRDWEKWGRNDPYFGVLSDNRFRAQSISDEDRATFFQTGETHIGFLLDIIRSRFDPSFQPGNSLDFGCGVGRLLIPLARCSRHATGVDVSASMLAEARHNCRAAGVQNVDFAGSDDQLSEVACDYDLIHSHIVFAHIHPSRGHTLIEGLARKVNPRGFIAIQVLYSCSAPRWKRAMVKLRYHIPLVNALRNAVRGRPLREPPMQLHVYSLPDILSSLNRLGFEHALLVTDKFDNAQFDSVILIAQRASTVAA
ncbi:MAG: class I SAM-dependent methyltransferase [Dokdonella sp.]